MNRLDNLGFAIKSIKDLYVRQFKAALADHSPTFEQCKALTLLARNEGVSQTQLAELAEIEPMTLVRILDRMEAEGWVERRPDPQDRRARRLYVTASARPVLERIDALSAKTRAEALRGLSRRERATLMTLLSQVHANLS